MSLAGAVRLGNAAATMSLGAAGATEAMRTAEECLRIAEYFGEGALPEIPD